MAIVDGRSKAGDYVDLIADRDVICVASNCAQVFNPCNGFNPTPVRIQGNRVKEERDNVMEC